MFRLHRFVLLCLLFLTATVMAESFVVDTGADVSLSACTLAVDDCSLRGAIERANATPAADRIEFSIPESDASYDPVSAHWRLLVGASALPMIEQEVVIDGFTQTGASANTNTPDTGGLNTQLKIELRPGSANAAQQVGLQISLNFFAQPVSVFRGLAINGFAAQIDLAGSSAHRVEGCFLGTNVSGELASVPPPGAPGIGITLHGPGAYVIGGLTPDTRNLISGMRGGIVDFFSANGLRVAGNLMGTNASGTAPIPHTQFAAISASGSLHNALIGGTVAAARNLISGNPLGAIYLSFSGDSDPFSGTRIEGNFIGTDVNGTHALGNGFLSTPQPAITVFGGGNCPFEIGGLTPGAVNLIAYNAGVGILVGACAGVTMHGNRFVDNRGPAIDLSLGSNPDGSTANDVDDADSGGNRLQNHPQVTLPAGFLPEGGSSVLVDYLIDSLPSNSSYPMTVNFYRAGCGNGGSELIAQDTYGLAEAQSIRQFLLIAQGNVLPLVVNVTDAAGNTSEFAPVLGETLFVDAFEDSPASFSAGRCD